MAQTQGRHDGRFSLRHASFPENADQMLAKLSQSVEPRDFLRLPDGLAQGRVVEGMVPTVAFCHEHDVDDRRREVDAENEHYRGVLKG